MLHSRVISVYLAVFVILLFFIQCLNPSSTVKWEEMEHSGLNQIIWPSGIFMGASCDHVLVFRFLKFNPVDWKDQRQGCFPFFQLTCSTMDTVGSSGSTGTSSPGYQRRGGWSMLIPDGLLLQTQAWFFPSVIQGRGWMLTVLKA